MKTLIAPSAASCATSASVKVSGSDEPWATTTVSPGRMKRARSSAAGSRSSVIPLARSDDALGAQPLDIGVAVAEALHDLVRVLAEARRAQARCGGFAGELDRDAEMLAALPVHEQHPAPAGVRIVDRLLERADRRVRDIHAVEPCQPLGERLRLHGLAQPGYQRALFTGGFARVRRKIRPPRLGEEVLGELVLRGAEREPLSVLRLVQVVERV